VYTDWSVGNVVSASKKLIFHSGGQIEETDSEKGEMSDWRGGSFGVFPGLWTMACDRR
jgi:hypothetical protein